MSTHEREITTPVLMCTPDGKHLRDDARGWSRTPLHTANLGEPTGNTKRWDYWAILAGDLVISSVYSDIDVLGLADVYWVRLDTHRSGGRSILLEAGGGIELPDVPGTTPLTIAVPDFDLAIVDDDNATRLLATWTEPDGTNGRLDATIVRPQGHESVNVVIPWNEDLFTFTSKQQARPAFGEVVIGDERWTFGGPDGDAWGVLDVGRGRWPARITWNWGGGAGKVGGRIVGLQFGAKWTTGTGFTENGVTVDGRLTKIGRELEWTYDWDHPMEPWRVCDPGGQLDVTLTPRFDKVTDVNAGEDFGSEVHQVFGTWSGYLITDDGERLEFDDLQGFAEEARQRW